MEKRLPAHRGMQLSMSDTWWSGMNSASRPACDISHTYYHTSHTHHRPAVINRCQWRITVCMRVRCVSPACWGLGSISGALSLNPVLMWPMRLSALSPLYTTQWSTSALLTPLPLQLSPSHTPLCRNLHIHTFLLALHLLPLSSKSNHNISVVLFVFIYPVSLVGKMYVIFFGTTVSLTQWSICPVWELFNSAVVPYKKCCFRSNVIFLWLNLAAEGLVCWMKIVNPVNIKLAILFLCNRHCQHQQLSWSCTGLLN